MIQQKLSQLEIIKLGSCFFLLILYALPVLIVAVNLLKCLQSMGDTQYLY